MAKPTELPDIGEVVGGMLRRVPRGQQPILLAPGWIPSRGEREDEIARRVEALYHGGFVRRGRSA
jgi:hypothetical protein